VVDVPYSKLPAAAALTGDEPVMLSQLSASVTITAATISAQASDNSYNDSGNGFIAAGFAVDDYVHVVGFTGDVANNIYSGQITALTAGKMTIGGTDGDVIVDDAAGESVTISKWVSRRATAQDIADLGGGSTTFRGALAYLTPALSGQDLRTQRILGFPAESYDTDGFHTFASTVTITIATPGVVTWAGHNFQAGEPIVLTTTGALPTGLTAGTTYYVVNPAANTFQLAATPGGSAIATSGTQSGTHTATNYSRLVVPSGVSKVRLSAGCTLSSINVDQWIFWIIRKNNSEDYPGAGRIAIEAGQTTMFFETNTAVVSVSSGDFFNVHIGIENVDASVNIEANVTWFAIEVIE